MNVWKEQVQGFPMTAPLAEPIRLLNAAEGRARNILSHVLQQFQRLRAVLNQVFQPSEAVVHGLGFVGVEGAAQMRVEFVAFGVGKDAQGATVGMSAAIEGHLAAGLIEDIFPAVAGLRAAFRHVDLQSYQRASAVGHGHRTGRQSGRHAAERHAAERHEPL